MNSEILNKPWGTELIVLKDTNYYIRVLSINPLCRTSLHNHAHRREIITVISGKGLLTFDNDEFFIKQDNTILIPDAIKHRIMNVDKKNVLIISELCKGSIRDEDIKRYEDDYGR
jgi:mannose-6-phosphate isomerase-like protein (cupin superfamily)